MHLSSRLSNIDWRWLLPALAGAIVPLSLAPFDFWPLAFISLGTFSLVLFQADAKQAFWRSWVFGLGMYGVGASWVFVSIYQFGNVAPAFALLLTVLFVVVLSTVFALPFIVLGRWLSRSPLGMLVALPALWVIGEWIRTWLFTGFPWLYLGYGHLQSWLAGWAPVVGVMGVSFIVAVTGGALAFLWLGREHKTWAVVPLVVCALLWGTGAGLQSVQWTQTYRQPVDVGIAQGNIPQDKKWDPAFLQPTLERYFSMTDQLWDNDWVIWPEAAMPLVYHQALPIIDELKRQALRNDAALITGVLYDSRNDSNTYYNSIVGIGLGAGIYHKQRLVPFGDYVPLRDWFGPVLSIFNLPMSVLKPGPSNQQGLQVGEALIAPSICYEIAYPDVVAAGAADAHILITISNDAWFGASIGPLQHMQIAQMRALETGRYLIRATNNGVSALVNDKGEITGRTDRFVQQTLKGTVELRSGMTPFMRWGSEPIVFLCMLLVGAAFFVVRE
ncbi:MAG: apolipoprotein N-acyltransferase [Cellvibrionaceae bacterium]